jgi:cell wall-associated NlpC family hydrolase
MIAGAAALAACPVAASADTAPAADAVASASAVTILLPGAPAVTLPARADRLIYPDAGGVLEVHGGAQAADPVPGARPRGRAQASVLVGKLFGGEVRFAAVAVQAHAWTSGAGARQSTARATIGRLVVLGKRVRPGPGTQMALAGWGTLTVLAGGATAGDLAHGRGRWATAIDVVLSKAHRGLPAGSEILIGSASAATARPPAPPPPAQGGGSGKQHGGSPRKHRHAHTGGSTGSPPTVTGSSHGGGATHQQRQRAAQAPTPAHHRRQRRPPAPPRPVVEHPVTLRGSVRARIVAAAASQIGWPYVWGGESEAEGGFDCSGLVDYAFAAAGRALPGRPTADVLWRMSQPIRRSMLRPGDLVFLLDRAGYAYHVGLYAGHGRVVVAAHHGAPVALRPLGEWQGYGRLWQRHSTRFPAHLLPPAHRHLRGAAEAPPIARPPAHAGPVAAGAPAVAVSGPARAPANPPRQPRRHAEPASTVAREDDLQPVADRARLRVHG